MKNPYNLPSKFKFIIDRLNRLECIQEVTITKNINKICVKNNVFSTTFIVSEGKDYLCESRVYNLDGVIADRFNVSIYLYLDFLKELYPRNKDIIKEFEDWLRQQEAIRYKDVQIKELRNQAEKLGCIVTIKT
jgi:hypothetical protein